jgi:hypothetical protein
MVVASDGRVTRATPPVGESGGVAVLGSRAGVSRPDQLRVTAHPVERGPDDRRVRRDNGELAGAGGDADAPGGPGRVIAGVGTSSVTQAASPLLESGASQGARRRRRGDTRPALVLRVGHTDKALSRRRSARSPLPLRRPAPMRAGAGRVMPGGGDAVPTGIVHDDLGAPRRASRGLRHAQNGENLGEGRQVGDPEHRAVHIPAGIVSNPGTRASVVPAPDGRAGTHPMPGREGRSRTDSSPRASTSSSLARHWSDIGTETTTTSTTGVRVLPVAPIGDARRGVLGPRRFPIGGDGIGEIARPLCCSLG